MDDSEPLNTATSIHNQNHVIYQSDCTQEGEFPGQELTDFGFVETSIANPTDSVLSINTSSSGDSSDSSTNSVSSFQDVMARNHTPLLSSSSEKSTKTKQKTHEHRRHPIKILGKQYHSTYNSSFQLDQGSLFWFTYRRDFPEIKPYKMTTDAGWGCMLRASQMLLAQALRLHYMGRMWRPSSIRNAAKSLNKKTSHDDFTTFIANAFADYSGPSFPFSLPNMVASGLLYDKFPGEWYGPGTAAYVLRDLVLIYQKNQAEYSNCRNKSNNSNSFNPDKDIFKIMVAQEGCVYKDSVEELMTEEGLISSTPTVSEPVPQQLEPHRPLHPLDTSTEPTSPRKRTTPLKTTPTLQWDTSLLLLIPLRLGLQKFNTDYSEALAEIFALPQSVGMLGGSPRHALWFYGSVRSGYDSTSNDKLNNGKEYKLFGLDPHTVQATPMLQMPSPTEESSEQNGKDRIGKKIVMSDKTMSSLHPSSYFNPSNSHSTKPVCMDIKNIDPSLALAFYCRDRADFESLVEAFSPSHTDDTKNKNTYQPSPERFNLFSIMDSKPDYNTHLSLLVEDFNDDSDSELQIKEKHENNLSIKKSARNNEEDGFIFL